MRKPRKKRVRKPTPPNKRTPMTPEELLEYGFHYSCWRGITGQRAEECATAFAYAGHMAPATAQNTRNIRSYQVKAGEWAVNDFRHYHARQQKRDQIYLQYRAGFPVPWGSPERDGVYHNPNPTPSEILLAKEEDERLLLKMQRVLTFFECELVIWTVLKGRSQASYCRKYGISQARFSSIVLAALRKLGSNFPWSKAGEREYRRLNAIDG